MSREEGDPYEWDHVEGCPESIWDDDLDSPEVLISAEELSERECLGCANAWNLWDRIIEGCGDAEWGEKAFAAFALENYIETWRPSPEEIDPADWEAVQIVKSERSKREGQLAWERLKEANQSSSAK